MIPPDQIAPALRHIVRKQKNVRVELAEVTGFDLNQQVVHASVMGLQPREIPYETLIVAAGVNQSYFEQDDYALFAPGMKTIDDALELRRRIFGAFEMAEMAPDATDRQRWLTVAIVGAGPTGVELAGQVRELAVRSLRREFRSFDAASVRVVLLDGGKEPLATFGDELSAKAARELERLGVELRMGARVVGVDATGVDLTDAAGATSRLDTYTTVWAAGVEASPLAAEPAKATGADLDRAGRIAVLPDLTLPGHPEVFVVGDMMALDSLPGVAEVAVQGGLHAANTTVRRLKDKPVRPFKYRDLGTAATIGRFQSVVNFHAIVRARSGVLRVRDALGPGGRADRQHPCRRPTMSGLEIALPGWCRLWVGDLLCLVTLGDSICVSCEDSRERGALREAGITVWLRWRSCVCGAAWPGRP